MTNYLDTIYPNNQTNASGTNVEKTVNIEEVQSKMVDEVTEIVKKYGYEKVCSISIFNVNNCGITILDKL